MSLHGAPHNQAVQGADRNRTGFTGLGTSYTYDSQSEHRPRLLDLFCGAGGAAMGYHRAGFDVVGVDIRPQPNYPFEFQRCDAVKYLQALCVISVSPNRKRTGFVAIHASPPCQAYSAMGTMWNARSDHPDLVAKTRELLAYTDLPYVIENVEGSPLINPVRICGSSVGLADDVYELRRHRLFETNWTLMVPPCAHGQRKATLGIYGEHARDRRRAPGTHHNPRRQLTGEEALARAREVMGMPWANWRELSQAVPPAYTELIGHQLLQHTRASRRDTVEATIGTGS